MFSSSTRTWAELHENAFARLGGAPRVLILDNLREGVLKPDIYDPTINPLYRDMLAHYGAVALPCRIQDPDRKGKVESSVGHAQKTPLKGQRFETLEEAQAYLDRWEEHWADTRIHGTTKRQVAAMFAEEKPALLAASCRAFSLLPVRRTRGSSGWLRGSRSRLLQRAAGLDRTPRPGAVGCACTFACSTRHRPTAARAPAASSAAVIASMTKTARNERRFDHQQLLHARRQCRDAYRRALPERCIASTGETAVRRILGILSLGQEIRRRAASTMPARRLWKSGATNIASCAVIWSAIRNCRSACARSIR